MTDRINGLTVVLTHDIRDDDCQCIIDAILMIKGVLSVKTNISDHFDNHVASERVRRELTDKMWEIIHPKIKND